MKVAIRFMRDDETLYRHVAEIEENNQLAEIHSAAFRTFREKFPDVALFEGNLTVGYEKG